MSLILGFCSTPPQNLIIIVNLSKNIYMAVMLTEAFSSFSSEVYTRSLWVPLKLVTTRQKILLNSWWYPHGPKRNVKSVADSASVGGDIYDVDWQREAKVRIVHRPRIGFITPGCGPSSSFPPCYYCMSHSLSHLLFTALVVSFICEVWAISCPSLFPPVHFPIWEEEQVSILCFRFVLKRGTGLCNQPSWTSAFILGENM